MLPITPQLSPSFRPPPYSPNEEMKTSSSSLIEQEQIKSPLSMAPTKEVLVAEITKCQRTSGIKNISYVAKSLLRASAIGFFGSIGLCSSYFLLPILATLGWHIALLIFLVLPLLIVLTLFVISFFIEEKQLTLQIQASRMMQDSEIEHLDQKEIPENDMIVINTPPKNSACYAILNYLGHTFSALQGGSLGLYIFSLLVPNMIMTFTMSIIGLSLLLLLSILGMGMTNLAFYWSSKKQ